MLLVKVSRRGYGSMFRNVEIIDFHTASAASATVLQFKYQELSYPPNWQRSSASTVSGQNGICRYVSSLAYLNPLRSLILGYFNPLRSLILAHFNMLRSLMSKIYLSRMRDLNALKCARMRDLNGLKYLRMSDLKGLRYAKLLTYLQISKCP